MKRRTFLAAVLAHAVLMIATASALNINLIYPPGSLFSATHDPAAKAAINAAAADISAAITTNLAAINNDMWTGTNGSATTTFDWYYQYGNPTTGSTTTIDSAIIAGNTVTIHVGARGLLGATLGLGGPSGAGFQSEFTYSLSSPSQIIGATASAESKSEIAYRRGGGPVIGTLAGATTIEGIPVSYSVDFGVAYGALALDWDGDDNGLKDDDTALNAYWHFNHTTTVASGKNDLYSVALHEMLHALGFGASDSWEANVVGTNWTGTNVIALTGSGAGLINPAQDHIAAEKMSTRAADGMPQEAVMDPSLTMGKRKYLTALDLAFLRDIGYATVDWYTPPLSPADFDDDGHVDAADLATWQLAYSVGANGDADNDGDTDGRDFLLWQREYSGASLTATVTVPEPVTLALIAMCGVVLLGRRTSTR